jgi:hypothetical protein
MMEGLSDLCTTSLLLFRLKEANLNEQTCTRYSMGSGGVSLQIYSRPSVI